LCPWGNRQKCQFSSVHRCATLWGRVLSGRNAGLKQIRLEQRTMGRPYRILLADDHVGFRREVRKILEEIPGVRITGEAGNRRELFELLRRTAPKLVILDVSFPDLRAGEGIQLIKLNYPETKVLIMVLDQESEYLSYGLAAGAAGVLPKQYVAGQMGRAITAVRQGKIYLPPRVPEKHSPHTAATMIAGLGRPVGSTDKNGDKSAS
jgi:DNA-binding NarL/FixJ family response regulator